MHRAMRNTPFWMCFGVFEYVFVVVLEARAINDNVVRVLLCYDPRPTQGLVWEVGGCGNKPRASLLKK